MFLTEFMNMNVWKIVPSIWEYLRDYFLIYWATAIAELNTSL